MKEQEILDTALENLQLITGADILLNDKGINNTRNKISDFYVTIELENKKNRFLVEVKNEIRQTNMMAILSKFQQLNENALLISQYIPSTLKNELQQRGINYLEVSGNCHIKGNGIYIYINDRKVTNSRLAVKGKVWKASGLKLIFSIINDPEILNLSYRQISIESGVALGNIGPFIEELKQEGFLRPGIRDKKNIYFVENKVQLMQRWCELFVTTLRPKLLIGRFRFLASKQDANWRNIKTNDFVWGGENAGAILTKYLHPEKYTLYTNKQKTKVMKELGLVPDHLGTIEVFQQFWSDKIQNSLNINYAVPPIIAYAELITSMDSRNQEVAERIKSGYIE